MDTLYHDVLIIGGGGAGLRAAIAVARDHPEASVGVVSKVYPMRSHTVSAEGGAAAVISPDDSLDDHAYDTISGSDWLADQDAVEILALSVGAPVGLTAGLADNCCGVDRFLDFGFAEGLRPVLRAISVAS